MAKSIWCSVQITGGLFLFSKRARCLLAQISLIHSYLALLFRRRPTEWEMWLKRNLNAQQCVGIFEELKSSIIPAMHHWMWPQSHNMLRECRVFLSVYHVALDTDFSKCSVLAEKSMIKSNMACNEAKREGKSKVSAFLILFPYLARTQSTNILMCVVHKRISCMAHKCNISENGRRKLDLWHTEKLSVHLSRKLIFVSEQESLAESEREEIETKKQHCTRMWCCNQNKALSTRQMYCSVRSEKPDDSHSCAHAVIYGRRRKEHFHIACNMLHPNSVATDSFVILHQLFNCFISANRMHCIVYNGHTHPEIVLNEERQKTLKTIIKLDCVTLLSLFFDNMSWLSSSLFTYFRLIVNDSRWWKSSMYRWIRKRSSVLLTNATFWRKANRKSSSCLRFPLLLPSCNGEKKR